MKLITKYKTVSETEIETFDQVVNKLLQEGWQPRGNPTYLNRGDKIVGCQAMVFASGDADENFVTSKNLEMLGQRIGQGRAEIEQFWREAAVPIPAANV